VRRPTGNIVPFAHALYGGALVDGPYHNPFTWGSDVTVGGGLDFGTPWFNHHLAIRLVQADYEHMNVEFGAAWGGNVGINASRISAGLVLRAGGIAPPAPVTLQVMVNPTLIFPGDPVTATTMAGNLNPKLNTIYIWSGPGVTGNGAAATVATATLAPGTYTVKAIVEEGKPGKEGLKPWQMADASASFTVKAFEPPTIGCTASPSTIRPGENSTVTASGVSPQNRPLTYNYTTTAGSIIGSGATVTYSSVGAPTGTVGITCSVTDDKGQTATANSSVAITAPYVPPVPHTQALCSISFATDNRRPTRVNNEAKACLDEVALDLQKQSDAKVVIVGTSDAKEKAATAKQQKAALKNKHLKVVDTAAERAVNTKDYLVKEKGIDAARISVTTSTADGQKVEDYLVPLGASFSSDVAGTTLVDEAVVKAQVRKPLGAKPAHKKAAARK
jgi:outer membrane protein OmpA-like peptidoglycan-associated protein